MRIIAVILMLGLCYPVGSGYAQECCDLRGDVDHSGSRDIADIVSLIDYMFSGGVAPPCPVEADINGSSGVSDISDLVALIDFFFQGGVEPQPCMVFDVWEYTAYYEGVAVAGGYLYLDSFPSEFARGTRDLHYVSNPPVFIGPQTFPGGLVGGCSGVDCSLDMNITGGWMFVGLIGTVYGNVFSGSWKYYNESGEPITSGTFEAVGVY